MQKLAAVFCLLCLFTLSGQLRATPILENETTIVSKRVHNFQGKSLNIDVRFVIHEVELNENDQSISIHLDLIESWEDSQFLSHAANNASKFKTEDDSLWSPDTLVLNTRESDEMKYLRKVDNGTVTKLTKLHVELFCPMDFFYFPFDKQICSFKFVNGEYPENDTRYTLNFSGQNNETSARDVIKFDAPKHAGFYHLSAYSIGLSNYQNDFGNFNQSCVELKFMFSRESERSFPVFYFPVIAMLMISIKSMYLKSTLHSIYISLASLLTMFAWIIICQAEIPHAGAMSMLDHYHFVCANLALNAAMIGIIIHLFKQSGSKSQEKQASDFNDVKLELNAIDSNNKNGSTSKIIESDNYKDSADSGNDEAHILKKGKFKQFVYFKMCKPAKKQLPISFLVINIIYWIWILIARLIVPSGFSKI